MTPRAGDAQSPTPSTGANGGQTTTSGTAPDLSPRASGADRGAGAHSPSPEEAQLGLPDELALGDILPPTFTTDGAVAGGEAPGVVPPAGEAAPDYGRATRNRWPLTAGLIVTLAILFFGGGFLWWRNRDSQYWPA